MAEEKAKEDRKAYAELVNDTITESFPLLLSMSEFLKDTKREVYSRFTDAMNMKGELYGVKVGQQTHTFTNAEGNQRITFGYRVTDNYRDTVNEGIAIVKEYLASLVTDNKSEMLVDTINSLMSRDQQGNLKASKVLKLQNMADKSGDPRFQDGVKIIRDSYAPLFSKQFIKAEYKDSLNEWKSVPLGVTEA